MKKVLVVAPHPDDAEIGMGGLIYHKVQAGEEVSIAVCTGDGDLVMRHSQENVKFERRMDEQKDACKLLGATALFLDMAPAARFDTVGVVKFVSSFDRRFTMYDEVYVPMPSYARDHCIVWEAALATLRHGVFTGCMYAYEQYLQANVPMLGGVVVGRKYIEISETDVFAKMQSIAKHNSQMNNRYDPEMIKNVAKFRGYEVGVPLAEMVYIVREVIKL